MVVSRWQGGKARVLCCFFFGQKYVTLQEINISHLGKRKIIFKYAKNQGANVSSLEGNTSLQKLVLAFIFFGFECDDSMILCLFCLLVCCRSHLHMGVSLNGGFPPQSHTPSHDHV